MSFLATLSNSGELSPGNQDADVVPVRRAVDSYASAMGVTIGGNAQAEAGSLSTGLV